MSWANLLPLPHLLNEEAKTEDVSGHLAIARLSALPLFSWDARWDFLCGSWNTLLAPAIRNHIHMYLISGILCCTTPPALYKNKFSSSFRFWFKCHLFTQRSSTVLCGTLLFCGHSIWNPSATLQQSLHSTVLFVCPTEFFTRWLALCLTCPLDFRL